MTSTDRYETTVKELADLAQVLCRRQAETILWNTFDDDHIAATRARTLCAPVVRAWEAAKDSAGRERRPADPADPQRAETSRLAGLALEALSELDLAAAARQS